jgi:3-methyladenine DNA glycosylase AlkC
MLAAANHEHQRHIAKRATHTTRNKYSQKKTSKCLNAATSEPVAVVVAVVDVAEVVTEAVEVVVEQAPKTVASARRKTSLI